MSRIITLIFVISISLNVAGNNIKQYLQKLDSCIALRDNIMEKKLERINGLKRNISSWENDSVHRNLYEQLFEEYYTFQFDSAMVWVTRALNYADSNNDRYLHQLFQIHKAELLAIGGFYSQANETANNVFEEGLLPELNEKYNETRFTIYNYWMTFCEGSVFESQYNKEKLRFLKAAIESIPKNTPKYYYLAAEYSYYCQSNHSEAEKLYKEALSGVTVNTRIYASASYALARIYKEQNRTDEYEKAIVDAAVSDQICPLKENYALQEIAMYLFVSDTNNAELATKYIYVSLDDAKFYNNRLRMLEISRKLPTIVSAYQQQISKQRTMLYWFIVGLSVVAIFVFAMMLYIWRQRDRIKSSRAEIQKRNEQLELANNKLHKANKAREGYVHLFMDIAALYMERITKYKSFVKMKIKVHQEADLLKTLNSDKIQLEENEQFLKRFDSAFMELYPTFIDEYNKLLIDGSEVSQTKTGALTTELRIAAIIRLGITESSEIATLLSYSPQTIYNYRSQAKSKAKNKATFDADIASLCPIT